MKPFLTAEWRYLVMLNYEVEAGLLEPLVPRGTELDAWDGRHFVSIVGFLFADTRVLRVAVPLHRTFEEVNLRFYVRRASGSEVRRAVVFIKELVPRRLIAWTARLTFNEPYEAVAMRHRHVVGKDGTPRSIEYAWRSEDEWSTLRLEPRGTGELPSVGSHEAFITEHYWGYTRQRDGSTIEYEVTHPKWRIWSARAASVAGDMAATYGPAMARVLSRAPSSAFLAEGSRITVGRPRALK